MPKRKNFPNHVNDWPNAQLEDQARTLVSHLDLAARRLLLAGDEHGAGERFSRSEIAVVDTLGVEGPMAMGELAGRVRLPLSTATRIVSRLVKRGVVQRERPEDHRRVVRVALATSGREFYEAAVTSRIVGVQAMLQRLTEDEQHELVRLVGKIATSIAGEAHR